MTDIILSGCMGKMGREVSQMVSQRDDCRIVAGVDVCPDSADFPVHRSFNEFIEAADVIIDFSNAAVVTSVLDYAVKNAVPAVICTTGLSEEQVAYLKEFSRSVPVFWSANMSIGVNLVTELAKTAAKVLSGFDIEIVEAHHRRKLDAPSGTAFMIADSISSVMQEKPRYEYDRHSRREQRPENEIGIHSVRGGTIVGEHEIIFAGEDEVVKISHSAGSRRIFANGSINAAIYLKNRRNGLYTMKDLINE